MGTRANISKGAVVVLVAGMSLGVSPAPAGLARTQSTAQISVSPSVSPPTLPFTVRGAGFGSIETIDVTFDGAAIGQAESNVMGSFAARVAVPGTAHPGGHTVTATGEESGSIASVPFVVRTSWSRFHFDIASTGYNPYENVLSPQNVSGLVQKWAVATAPGESPSPVTAGGRLYVAPADGVVRAIDPATGATLWTYATGGSMSGAAPDVYQGVLYVGNENGDVFALDSATGKLIWTVRPTERVLDPVVATGQMLLVNVQNDIPGGTRWETWGLDRATGSPLWQRGSGAVGSPAVGSGVVYVSNPFLCGSLAISAADGTILWWRTSPEDTELCSTGPPALADGHIFFAVNNNVLARQASGGRLAWSVGSHYVYSTDAVADGVVYWVAYDGFVRALDEATGAERWSTDLLSDAVVSSPAVANGVLFVATIDGVLRALDAATGAILWASPPASAPMGASPAVSDGIVYTSSDDGTVYAYGLP
jgi:outer membrane protein assembly factor BamB